MVNLKKILTLASEKNFAVGAFNVYNAESVQAVIESAEEEKSPVIMITGPLEIPLLGLKGFVDVCKVMTKKIKVPVCLHLDHSTDPDFVIKAIETGFPSVMIDASGQSFDRNVKTTKKIVDFAHRRGVTVEGEIGRIGKVMLSKETDENNSQSTDPQQALEFVKKTGVDALAINIGNAHGIYQKAPKLDFVRLHEIAELVKIPVVLHGGSSTPVPDLKKLILFGISKVNIATELHVAFSKVVKEDLEKGNGFTWTSVSLIKVKRAQKKIIRRWMNILGSSGKADLWVK
jgi:ketose-bisphosphate aldolase